jgi:hypothetical protein
MQYRNGDIVRVVQKVPARGEIPRNIEQYLGTMQKITIREKPYYGTESGCCLTDDVIAGYAIFNKSSIRTGDVILRRNGSVDIAIVELNVLLSTDGTNVLDSFNDQLFSRHGEEYDIIAVRRPTYNTSCTFKAFEENCGTLVYDRNRASNFTLDEVSKLLGVKVKIVKNDK